MLMLEICYSSSKVRDGAARETPKRALSESVSRMKRYGWTSEVV